MQSKSNLYPYGGTIYKVTITSPHTSISEHQEILQFILHIIFHPGGSFDLSLRWWTWFKGTATKPLSCGHLNKYPGNKTLRERKLLIMCTPDRKYWSTIMQMEHSGRG